VIGGGEVNLTDLTSAYGVFANDGIRNPYTGILEVDDSNGTVLEKYEPREEDVLPKNTALTVSDILSDNVARTPTFGASSALSFPDRQVAVKTGTTNNNKDAWTIGYTPSIVVGVWAGNNNNTQMKSGGSTVAGPIWNKFMAEVLKVMPPETFEKPEIAAEAATLKPIFRGIWQGNQSFFIDKISGKLATPDTPPETREEKVVTDVHSILYWVDKSDPLGPPPANPGSDPQFNRWEIPVQNWWAQNKYRYPATTWSERPAAADDVHTGSSGPIISILEPNNATIYPPSQRISLKIASSGLLPLQKVDIFINGAYVETDQYPFTFSFAPEELGNLQDSNNIKVVAYDTAYNKSESEVTFRVR
jgi:membrane peptidoglycan carboxypeptidase